MKRLSIVLPILAAGCASAVQVPENLNPGANESLALVVPAKGVQVYECRDGKWAFVAPEAEQRADAPAAGNIPWLLLGTKSVGSAGTFSKVTSIQRVATVGGVAPVGGCAQGAQARVDYTADYYFFSAK